MRLFLRRDKDSALSAVAKSVHDLLSAESCRQIFIRDEANPNDLVLAAHYSDLFKGNYPEAAVRRPMHNRPGGGLLGYLANKGRTRRLHGDGLVNHRAAAGRARKYLKSGKCFSAMFVPMKDRKNRVLGVLVVDNKKGADGKAGDTIPFTRRDEAVAKVLVDQILVFLENLRTSEILRNLIGTINQLGSDQKTVLDAVLKSAADILRAKRCDLAVVSHGDLRLHGQYGTDDLKIGEPLPQPSIIRSVWRSGKPRVVRDVELEADYYRADAKSRSQITIPLEWAGRRFGVLSAESTVLDGFDEIDKELLVLLGQYAAIAYQTMGREAHYRTILGRLLDNGSSTLLLDDVLRSLDSMLDIEGGIVYLADDTEQRSLRSTQDARALELSQSEPYSYRFEDDSLACHVFRTRKPLALVDPNKSSIRSVPNPLGLKIFRIEGPLLGVPLIHREKAVGVLVLWRKRGAPGFTDEQIQDLMPYASVPAASIARARKQARRAHSSNVQFSDHMPTELSFKHIMHWCLMLVRGWVLTAYGLFSTTLMRTASFRSRPWECIMLMNSDSGEFLVRLIPMHGKQDSLHGVTPTLGFLTRRCRDSALIPTRNLWASRPIYHGSSFR